MSIGGTDDRLLVERFRHGDREALSSLYRAHYQAVFRFALYMTDDPDTSAEIVQETFLWLIRHPAAFDPDRGSLPSFLSGVARKLLLHRERDQRRFQPLASAGEIRMAAVSSDDTMDLQAAILELPEAYRAAVVLCGIENKTYEEAAAILDCAVGTVRSRLSRAKLLLARKLNEHLTTTGRLTHG